MKALVGTGQLIRLILRRDRFLLPLWIIVIAIIPLSLVSAITALYPTEAARQELAGTVGLSPVFLAFLGPIFNTTIGGLVAWRGAGFLIVVGVISLLTVIRHTRAEEEAGRRELLGSAVVGRQSGLAAGLSVALGANLVLAILITLGMISQKLPVGGSAAIGLQYAAAGWVFSAIGAVAAQVTNRAGTARAVAFGVLGLAFVLRVGGDVSSFSWLTWLSPLGWAEKMRPYGDERWWILAIVIGSVLLLSGGAAWLLSRRDIGAGLLPSRAGPAGAAAGFRSPLALAWRLHRNLMLGWALCFAVFGAAMGGVAGSLVDLLKDSPQLQAIIARLGGNSVITDAFFAGVLGVFATVAAGYAVQATLRMQSEENALRGELVLATAVGRVKWAVSHLTFAFTGPAVAIAVLGLTAGLVHGINVHDLSGQLPRVMAGALIQLPAVWMLIGIGLALYGLLPRRTGLSWGAVGLFIFLGELGAALRLPQWALDISPFTHIPRIPGGGFSPEPIIILVAATVLLGAAGLIGFRRRDFGKG